MNELLISIVMPSLNQANYLPEAVNSILEQSYERLEVIVADGGSTDGTMEILRDLAHKDPRIQWMSQKDRGPADAINRALARTRGEIIGWLNSDDLYAPNAIERMVMAFTNNPNWIMCYGQAENVDPSGAAIGAYPTRRPDIGIQGFLAGCFISQPTVFFKFTMTKLLGPLDVNLHTAFDYDYWLRAFAAFPNRIGFVDAIIARSRLHSDCITRRMRSTVAIEGMALCTKYLGRADPHWAATYLEEISSQQDPASFKQSASQFLDAVSQYISDADLQRMKDRVKI